MRVLTPKATEGSLAAACELVQVQAVAAATGTTLEAIAGGAEGTRLCLQVPLDDGTRLQLEGVGAIARHLGAASPRLYPDPHARVGGGGDCRAGATTARLLGAIDQWAEAATSLQSLSVRYLESKGDGKSGEDVRSLRTQLEHMLTAVEARLQSGTYLAGDFLTLADLLMVAPVRLLMREAVGPAERAALAQTMRWLNMLGAHPQLAALLGELPLFAGASWPIAEPAEASTNPAGGNGGELSEKEKKKLAKQAEKEAKKAKAEAKAAKAKAAAAAKAEGGEKKDKKKPKKEETKDAAFVNTTPKGEKKDMTQEMLKAYTPKAVEAAWYDWWMEQGYFKPDLDSKKPPYVIVIPPPNVTGTLHLGHALTNSIQDTITRWRRMSGYNCLWVPGTDHAGIATQSVVEKKLMRSEGIGRRDLGREKFLEKVWEWKTQYGGKICDQLKRLGSSLDWSREAFTMDDKLSAAVQEAFVTMHEKDLIYRDNRLVNWCCSLQSAISDIEVDYVDLEGRTQMSVPGYKQKVEFGAITSFAYPLEDGSGEIVVATTRPETMLGDTAVAVHPEDPRYMALHGKFVVHPFNGRKLPIITDAELVDMNFGTGAVKITPAHDPNDFATGKRHNLEFISIFTDEGAINANGGERFRGQKRFEARVTVVDALKEADLFRGVADNKMRLGLCSRTKDVIEPIIKPQWWVSCGGMAKAACDAVRSKELEIIPSQFEAVWFRWLEDIRDWCISRQLWWGHRIPSYYIRLSTDPTDCGAMGSSSEMLDRWVVARSKEEAEAKAKARFPGKDFTLSQDEDVLDTWFSSGLFPFSVMGWPNQTDDLAAFYPTSLLETGHDILFFWVARMVMMGMTLTGKVPFNQVFLHAMVRDAHGRKMSKSLGNVIDPLEVIEGIDLPSLQKKLEEGNLDPKEVKKAQAGQKADFPNGIPECGTDALRFALVAYTTQARDINLDINRVAGYRMWCNKLWNAIRFAIMNLGDDFVPSTTLDVKQLPMGCRWILSRLNKAIEQVVENMEAYNFTSATTAIYDFWQYRLCDVFIELIKAVMYAEDGSELAKSKTEVRDTLWTCLDCGLRLLHPFMPFVTEELWQRLPRGEDARRAMPSSIMIADYPKPNATWEDSTAEVGMELIEETVHAIRSLRSSYNLPPRARPEIFVLADNTEIFTTLQEQAWIVASLSSSKSATAVQDSSKIPAGCGVGVVREGLSIYVSLAGVVDAAQEVARLGKKQEELQKMYEQLLKKMSVSGYEEKVPQNVKDDNNAKKSKLTAEIETCGKALQDFMKLL